MKAVTYSRYGSPAVLQLKNVDKPAYADNEVLIQVHAAEVTKSDCEMRSFTFSVSWFWLPLRIAFGIFKPKRQILGGYFAGEVCAIGKEVSNLSIGDQVFGSAQLRLGAYGEYMALPADYTIVSKPDNMSFIDAAAVPLGGLNALHFMRRANIKPGEKVLINGAGGSIGAHAIQIAKAFGAEVTAVDSEIKQDFLRSLGAEHIVDYTKQDFTEQQQTYDVILDMVPNSNYSKIIKILNPYGRYLTGNPRLMTMLRCLFTNLFKTKFNHKTASFAFARETQEELLTLKQMIEAGKIRSIVDKAYPMQDAASAHHRVETELRIGAVVLAISTNN